MIYSKGNNDECYTPEYGVIPILKFLHPNQTVWCPFDTIKSNFVKLISKTNKVIHTHINDGQDFYNYYPEEHFDIIISNPPFTNKRKIFERCLSFDKPFALLMTNAWLNDAAPKRLFKDKELQLLMFDKRISYINKDGTTMDGKITFSSSYYCYNLLTKQIIMENL